MLYTFSVAFTNFGDGHRGTKQEAIARHRARVAGRDPGRRPTTRSPSRWPTATSSSCWSTRTPRPSRWARSRDCPPLDGAEVSDHRQGAQRRRVRDHSGQRARRRGAGARWCRPSAAAIKSSGLSRAIESRPTASTTPAATASPTARDRWTADEAGLLRRRRRQQPDPGLAGQRRVGQLHPGRHRPQHLRPVPRRTHMELRLRSALLSPPRSSSAWSSRWRLHSRRMRGTQDLPDHPDPALRHAVLRDAAGLAGHVQHRLRSDQPGTGHGRRLARHADRAPGFGLLLVKLWLGFPYMFLVTTGALQAIPRELTEASADGRARRGRASGGSPCPLLLSR